MNKKKLVFLLLICTFFVPGVFAADGDGRIPDRGFELGIANFGVGFSNNFISAKDILKEHVVIDLDDLKDGFAFNANAMVSPIYFDYNKDGKWGFGLHLDVSAYGDVNLAGEMLTFSEGENVKSDFTAAVFADANIPIFFTLFDKLKIKIKPSVYYPVIYAEPDLSYTYKIKNGENHLYFNTSARIYTATSFEDGTEFDLTASPGFDWSIGAEFPLSDAIGLSKALPFLDFDIGLDLIGIPMVTASMTDYMEMTARIGESGKPIDLLNGDIDGLIDMSDDAVYGKEKIKVTRPFKMYAWADWRPFMGSQIFTLTPTVGFSVSQMYVKPTSFEGGLEAKLDLGNVFLVTAGVGYYNHLWKNSIDLALNFRAFEFDIGASLQAPTLAKSWAGGGFGVVLGFKFGW